MKYSIEIEYVDASLKNKTAKISIKDENGKSIIKNESVSLPNDLFNVNKTASYFGTNESRVRKVDFSDVSIFNDFYENSNFSNLTKFNEEDQNENKKYFDSANDKYIIQKRNVLFFPQVDGDKLGVDQSAFITHSKVYNRIAEIFKDEKIEFSLSIRKKRFSIFSSFEDRDLSKYSNINKAYNTYKELLQKNKLFSSEGREIINERLKAESKKIIAKIKGVPLEDNLNENDITEIDLKETIKPKETFNFEEELTIIDKNRKDDLFLILESGIEKLVIDNYQGKDEHRILPFDYLPKFYSYFMSQDIEVNELNIKQIMNTEKSNMKETSFFSNENGFFIQIFSDHEKLSPLGIISFDYKDKLLTFKNETSNVTLKQNKEDSRLIDLNAIYGDNNLELNAKMINIIPLEQSINKNDIGTTIIEFKMTKNGIKNDDVYSYIVEDKINYNVDDNLLSNIQSRHILNVNDERLKLIMENGYKDLVGHTKISDLLFKDRNEELFNKNQVSPDVIITKEDLEEISPNVNNSNSVEKTIIETPNISSTITNKEITKNNDNKNYPTPTNDISPFPEGYIRIMTDEDFLDSPDRTIGVNMLKIKHQFLTNDPTLSKIDVTALEYEYFYKPFKEQRELESKNEEIEREKNQRQLWLKSFEKLPIEMQVKSIFGRSREERLISFNTEEDPLEKIILSQSLDEQIKILSNYSKEERINSFSGEDILEKIMKENGMELKEDPQSSEPLIVEPVSKIIVDPIIVQETEIVSPIETTVSTKEALEVDTVKNNSEVITSNEIPPIDQGMNIPFPTDDPTYWDNFSPPQIEDEPELYQYVSSGSWSSENSYSDSSVHQPQHFENNFPESADPSLSLNHGVNDNPTLEEEPVNSVQDKKTEIQRPKVKK